MTFKTRSEADTMALGAALAPMLEKGDTVLLTGDLGAGKSVLARGIARGMGVEGPMPSRMPRGMACTIFSRTLNMERTMNTMPSTSMMISADWKDSR